MSPEQCRGEAVDEASDIYSMGVLLYRMLTGALPFSANHPIGFLTQHLQTPTPDLPPPAPRALDAVVKRAMAKEPAARFATAEAMRAALWHVVGEPEGMQPFTSGSIPTGLATGASSSTGDASLTLRPDATTVRDTDAPPVFSARLLEPAGSDASTVSDQRVSPVVDAAGDLAAVEPKRPSRWLLGGGLAVVVAALTAWWVVPGVDEAPTRIAVGAPSSIAPDVAALGPTAPAESSPAPAETLDAMVPDGALPDAALPDVAAPDAVVPDARPQKPKRRTRRPPARRRAPKPTPVDPAARARIFDDRLKACNCPGARAALVALQKVDPPTAAVEKRRYEEECEMHLPDTAHAGSSAATSNARAASAQRPASIAALPAA